MGLNEPNDFSTTASETPSVALTIAGTDSGGSAGVAADLKSFAAQGVHGVFAVTVVTAQNSMGISAVEELPASMLAAQIDALASDFRIRATKTGLLFSVDSIEVVAERAEHLGPLVVDPVLVSSSGAPLFAQEVVDAYVRRLFPAAAIITPNVAEAALILGRQIESRESALASTKALLDLGPGAVLTTGLLDAGKAVDVLATSDGAVLLEHDLVHTRNVLGTGCSLSASIAARLASGDSLEDAVSEARRYVLDGLRGSASWKLGSGQGPIDHFSRWPGVR